MNSIHFSTKKNNNQSAGLIPPLLLADLRNLYNQRAKRLQQLAKDHPLADYLLFLSNLAAIQDNLLKSNPYTLDVPIVEHSLNGVLDVQRLQRQHYWQEILHELLVRLRVNAPAQVNPTIERLLNFDKKQLEHLADCLLNNNYAEVGSDYALFIWAALSFYWLQMSTSLTGYVSVDYGEQRQWCPLCHSMPVASVVHIGSNNGLRYLHCSLCESEWHMVRIKCSNCEQSKGLNYWFLEDKFSAVKAESCDNCNSYLKILYQEKDPYLDVIADDLAAVFLDHQLELKGYARSSINPYLFPAA